MPPPTPPQTNAPSLLLLGTVLVLTGLLAYNYTTAQPCGSSPSSASSDGGSWGSNGISESSSGKLFHAVKVRTYSGERLFAKWQPGSKPSGPAKALRPKTGPQCKNWAVTTTIFPPTKTVNQIAALPDWCLVIAGDKKAPTQYNVSGGAIYLSPADQERMPFATGKLLRWNHFGRKNLGFLYAVQHGARWVYDTDDDNELQSMSQGIPIPRPNALVDEVQTSFKLYNLYPQMSTVPSAWPRGFPLEHVKDNRTFKASFTRRAWPARRVGVVQSLADHDPDVDGIYRLTQTLPFTFPPASTRAAGNKDGRRLEAVVSDEEAAAQAAEEEARRQRAIKAIASGLQQAPAAAKRLLSPKDDGRRLKANGGKKRSVDGAFMTLSLRRGTMMPYNAQATLHSYDALWGLLLPCTVHGRVTDIWRAYYTQRLLWDAGFRIAFSTPWVTQYRNAHNYLADFNSELPLYQQAGALVDALLAWKPAASTMPGRVEELYILMYEMNIVGLDDVKLAQAWLQDLVRLGYRFPPLVRAAEDVR